MIKPEYIVVHTAAYRGRNCDRDMIDQWHRELNKLVAEGILSSEYATTKTCPGSKVDMTALRGQIREHREIAFSPQLVEELGHADKDELLAALTTLERVSEKVFPNANAELKEFLSHPEVIAFRS